MSPLSASAATARFGLYPPAYPFPFPQSYLTQSGSPGGGELDLTFFQAPTDFVPFSIQFAYGYQNNSAAFEGQAGPFPPLCSDSPSDTTSLCLCGQTTGSSACSAAQTVCVFNCQMNYVAALYNCSGLTQSSTGQWQGQATLLAETAPSSVNRSLSPKTAPQTSPAANLTSTRRTAYPAGVYCLAVFVDYDDILFESAVAVNASVALSQVTWQQNPYPAGSTFEDNGYAQITGAAINEWTVGVSSQPNAIWMNVQPTAFVGPMVSSSTAAPVSSSAASSSPASSSLSSSRVSSSAASSSVSSSAVSSSAVSPSVFSSSPASSSASSSAFSSSPASSSLSSSRFSSSPAPSSVSSSPFVSSPASSSVSSSPVSSSAASVSSSPASSSVSSTVVTSSVASSSTTSSPSLARASSSATSTALNPSGSAGVVGDPQFNGLRGQSYQVHGYANEYYAVLSTPTLHLNALFHFLDAASCSPAVLQRTACWSHPGNYFGAVSALLKPDAGVTLHNAASLLQPASRLMRDLPRLERRTEHAGGHAVATLEVTAGPAAEGLRVTYAGAELPPSDDWRALSTLGDAFVFVFFPSRDAVLLMTGEFLLRLDNSDRFLNLGLAMTPQLAQRAMDVQGMEEGEGREEAMAAMPHGLLGQTWSSARHQSPLRVVEGDIDDYRVRDSADAAFPFTRFQ